MKRPPVEARARAMNADIVASVRRATATVAGRRLDALSRAFDNPHDARRAAAEIKEFVLDNLRDLLVQLETNCIAAGIDVHWAVDAEDANRLILNICRRAASPPAIVVKAKSMATEEIHLNAALEGAGYEVVESDLGELVVQLAKETPSHIVAPIIHKHRGDIAKLFHEHRLGPYTEDPEELTAQARAFLREKFRTAAIGVSGVNFAIASTGRLVLVENEGNNRLSTTAPRIHIAVMGIEKVLPSEGDLPLFLRLLAGSATGQEFTTYVHMISGPRKAGIGGPEEVHLVLLDNGRTRALNSNYRAILRCIRCGACLNACPVFRQVSGHGYGHVYSGPLGAVLAPAMDLHGRHNDLASASSLCGACEEVCPVKIPIPEMLVRLRSEGKHGISWKMYAFAATNPRRWRTTVRMLPLAKGLPSGPKSAWAEFRDVPKRSGRDFRRWWNERA
jgi:L-lactate dehydrogenase complex protein LldF